MSFSEFPEMSWSSSKMSMLKECPRAYYINYYMSHNGWLMNSNFDSKEAYKLKKLTSIHMVKGTALHEQFKAAIEEVRENKELLVKTENDMINAVINRLREAVIESKVNIKSGRYDSCPKGIMLQEYYYGGYITNEEADKLKAQVEVCIENFFKTRTFDRISSLSDLQIIENDESDFNDCLYCNNVKLYFKVDLLYKEEDGTYVVVDWKSGKYDESDKEQLLMYVYYAAQKYGVDVREVKGRLEYLLSGETYELCFSNDEFIYMEQKIEDDIKEMNMYLIDVESNKPKGIEYFTTTDNDIKCSCCKFRRICHNDIWRKY